MTYTLTARRSDSGVAAQTNRPRLRVVSLAAAGMAALLFTGGSAVAQDQPATGSSANAGTQGTPGAAGMADPQMRSPFWGDDSYPRDGRRSRDRYRDGYDDEDDGDDTFAENFPVDLAGEVAPARERYMALKWSYWTARNRLGDRVQDLRHDFEDAEEFRNLRREREELQRTSDAARRRALAPLQDDSRYQALIELERQTQERIREAHSWPEPDMAEIAAMSELAVDYARERREMENGLTGTDSEIESAGERLREIHQRQRELEDEFDRDVRNDEQLAMLRDQIEQLRIAYLSAGAYYDSAVRAADIAADFAYYNALARAGAYGGSSPYGYSGYGYPYGGGRYGGGLIFTGVGDVGDGSGPVYLRPVIFPNPILSNTFRGISNTVRPLDRRGGTEPPPIPVPDDEEEE